MLDFKLNYIGILYENMQGRRLIKLSGRWEIYHNNR